MVRCGFCKKEYPEARNRNGVEKKYCSDKCRWLAFGMRKRERLIEELRGVFERHNFS